MMNVDKDGEADICTPKVQTPELFTPVDRAQKLVYLRSSLEKEVANVPWDYGKDIIDSLSGLTKTLEMRFGGKAFTDKCRIELRNSKFHSSVY